MPKAEIRKILDELLEQGFFKEWRTLGDVINKLDNRGFTVTGKKAGNVAQMLTRMCRDAKTGLEREKIPVQERKGSDMWRYNKVR